MVGASSLATLMSIWMLHNVNRADGAGAQPVCNNAARVATAAGPAGATSRHTKSNRPSWAVPIPPPLSLPSWSAHDAPIWHGTPGPTHACQDAAPLPWHAWRPPQPRCVLFMQVTSHVQCRSVQYQYLACCKLGSCSAHCVTCCDHRLRIAGTGSHRRCLQVWQCILHIWHGCILKTCSATCSSR